MSAMGVAIRHVFNLRHKGADPRATMAVAAALGLVTITYVTLEKSGEQQAGGDLAYADVQPILAKHCVTCHAPHPTNPAFAAPPLGVLLDTGEHAGGRAAHQEGGGGCTGHAFGQYDQYDLGRTPETGRMDRRRGQTVRGYFTQTLRPWPALPMAI
jgi:mono/diheme cytochrome c family protein